MKAQRRYFVARSIVADTIAPDHFLKKVFKKKAGGTAIGNLIRLAANKASGGILGTGANRIPVTEKKSETLPVINASTPLQEAVSKSTDSAIRKSVLNLSNAAQERLLNGQTDASNLPKTRMIRNAERTAEQIAQERQPIATANSSMMFNPLLIGGVIVGIIVLVLLTRKG